MIGIMNVPCDSATEYYASPPERRQRVEASMLQNQLSCNSDNKAFHQSSQKRLFSRRRSSQVDYLKDGRKMFDGKVVENATAPQLWEKLLLRSFAHKLEIPQMPLVESEPAPTVKYDKSPLMPLVESVFECTASTLSLVSKGFLEQEAEKPSSDQESTETKKRSHSYDCPRKLSLDLNQPKQHPI